jgi:hypothetical protein
MKFKNDLESFRIGTKYIQFFLVRIFRFDKIKTLRINNNEREYRRIDLYNFPRKKESHIIQLYNDLLLGAGEGG